jgi:TPR repeat protein
MDGSQAEAVKWYRKAGEQGYADAQFELGRCYSEGLGVAKDNAEAVK